MTTSPTICALLGYYDENPTWLQQLVGSLPQAGVTKLVAVDGAYRLYPNAQPRSKQNGKEALRQACERTGIALTHHTPDTVWDDELHKRSFMFELAETVTSEHDWYFVVDADERVSRSPDNLPALLGGLDTLVGEATLWDELSNIPLRMFFRALRGLKVVGNHYTYQLPDGRNLWGDNNDHIEPATAVPVFVEHRDRERPQARRAAKFAYYDKRDREAPEAHTCAWCAQPATGSIPWNWRWSGPGIVGDRTGCCEACRFVRLEESIAQAQALGVDASHLRESGRQFR